MARELRQERYLWKNWYSASCSARLLPEYVKTIPQHIRAARQLESIKELKKGDRITYIKIVNKPGVKPLELARKRRDRL